MVSGPTQQREALEERTCRCYDRERPQAYPSSHAHIAQENDVGNALAHF